MDRYIPEGYELTPFLSEERRTEFQSTPELGEGIEPGKQYLAVLETSKGRMVLELFADRTSETVNSFAYLTRHHYYDGVLFHRVIDGFMAQTGDPTGTGMGGPGYRFGLEVEPDLRFDRKGVLGMARTQDPNSNGSQFFITYGATPHLDGQYTVFGRAVEGADVLDRLERVQPGMTGRADRIETAHIVEKQG